MQRGMGGTAFEPLEERQDRELTLGPLMLTALVTGLLALCGICFVAGYAVGHGGSPAAQAVGAPPLPASAPVPFAASNQPKPQAAQSTPQPQTAVVTGSAAPSETTAPTVVPAVATSAPASGQPLVRAALPLQPGAAQPVTATGQSVQPALVPPTAWMVQIAAVAQQEDADVLVAALRRRGYAVSAHRDPADGQLHVRVGPFATHTDAASMRQKLMNDGYNAIIQP